MSSTGDTAYNATTDTHGVKKQAGTDYLVFKQEAGGRGWEEETTIRATSADAAIRRHLDGKTSTAESYVAVPARSWHPVRVKVETRSVVTLEGA